MRARWLKCTLIGLLAMGFVGIAALCPASEKPIELKIANYDSSAHHQSKVTAAWAKRVEQETNARIRFTIFPDASLLKGPETWTGTVQGVADIGVGWMKGFGKEGMNPYHWSPIGWAATYGAKDAMTACKIGDEIARIFPPYAEEMNELKILANYSLANLLFYSRRYPIRGLADLKGRTVRSGNKAVSAFVKYAGGNPLFMSMGEVYLALQKGTIDVMAGYPSTLKGYRHAEVVKYVTIMHFLGSSPNLGFAGMNWNSWNKLPPDLQKVIENSAVRYNYESRMLRVDEVTEGIEFAKSKGNEIMEFKPEESLKVAEILKKIAEEDAKRMNAKGLKGTEFMEAAYKAAARYITLEK